MYDKDYLFKAYFRVKGTKNRKSHFIKVMRYYDLADAWHTAINIAVSNTEDDEILDSIELVES